MRHLACAPMRSSVCELVLAVDHWLGEVALPACVGLLVTDHQPHRQVHADHDAVGDAVVELEGAGEGVVDQLVATTAPCPATRSRSLP